MYDHHETNLDRPLDEPVTIKRRYNEPYRLPNTKKYPRLFAWLLRLLQRRCQHYALKADILEGCAYPHAVRWCETCGGIWTTIEGTPCGWIRLPEPTWEN